MPRSWSCSTNRAPTILLLALGAAAAAAPATRGETVLSRRIELSFEPGGGLEERVALQVRLDEAGDLDAWSPYAVPLDENRTLISASGWALRPDGSRVVLHEDDVTTVEGVGGAGVLHSSLSARLLRFPPLPAGSVLNLAYDVREEPWLESTSIELLAGDAPVESLSVEVRGAPDGFRWRIDPPPAASGESGSGALAVEGRPDGLRVTGTGIEPPSSDHAARPVLHIAWGPAHTWSGLGRWYQSLLDGVPRGAEAVRSAARRVAEEAETPRARLEAVLDFVRRRVRYVAVEMGVGGYRPSPPAEVLERRWGDCKDKSLLLVDLLADLGVEAHPALVRLDDDRGIDEEFPAADQFNHVIVAVPAEALDAAPGDAALGGYLFVDPTQEMGGLSWLHPALQGQRALVVRGEASELATVPVLVDRETRSLSLHLVLDERGDAAGDAELRLTGASAWSLTRSTASATSERLVDVAMETLSDFLPGAELGPPRWRQGEVDGVPMVELSASVRLPRLVEGTSVRSLALPSPTAFPEPSALEELEDTLAVRPVRWTTVWELDASAAGCRPEAADRETANDVGRFRQTVTPLASGGFRVERLSELDRRWIAPELAAQARELSLTERRAGRRRLRLRCAGDG